MEEETESDEQEKLVRDALVENLAETVNKLREEKDNLSSVEDELQDARNKADELEQKTRKAQTTTEQLQLELQQEKKSRRALEKKLTLFKKETEKSKQDLEEKLAERLAEEVHKAETKRHERSVAFLQRASFVILALLLLVLLPEVIEPWARWLGHLAGYPGHRFMKISVLLLITVWALLFSTAGQKIKNIRTWKPFYVFYGFKIWLFKYFLGPVGCTLLWLLIWGE